MSKQVVQAMTKAAFDASEAATNSVVTIAARLPIFAECLMAPSAAGFAEVNEAVTEKLAAGIEGAVAGLAEWNAMLMGAFFRPLTPVAFATGAMRVLERASHPAHTRVRANAARLSRRG